MISLNVGGTLFQTRRETLVARDCFFRALVEHADRVGDNALFVDRDPTHFRYVLNHLRNATALPSDQDHLQELRVEADFYSLPELVERIDAHVSHARARSVAHQLSIIATRVG